MGEQVALGATCSRNCGLMRAGQTAFFVSCRGVSPAPLAASMRVLHGVACPTHLGASRGAGVPGALTSCTRHGMESASGLFG